MVGAPGFEPGAACAQASYGYFRKPFLHNTFLDNKRVVERFGSERKCRNAPRHAQSPLNFPLSKATTKGSAPSSSKLDASLSAPGPERGDTCEIGAPEEKAELARRR